MKILMNKKEYLNENKKYTNPFSMHHLLILLPTKMNVKTEKTISESMKVEVSFPECVHIELVQANDLKHYEIFLWLVSLSASTASGFWVSFSTITPISKVLLGTSLAFSLLTLIFGWVAYYYRTKISATKLKKILLLENFNNK